MRLGKKSFESRPPMMKKIFSFLARQYYCHTWDLDKIQSTLYHHRKKNFLLLLTLHGLRKKINRHSTYIEKKYIRF